MGYTYITMILDATTTATTTTTIISQAIHFVQSIWHAIDTTIWPLIGGIVKSIAGLLIKILELAITAIKWVIAKA